MDVVEVDASEVVVLMVVVVVGNVDSGVVLSIGNVEISVVSSVVVLVID